MDFVTDLHLHSKYSRAVSRDMNLLNMALWAKKKGLDILSTGDWTHPLWFREITSELTEDTSGIFKLKGTDNPTKFILSVEIASIYSQGGRVHRIHNLIFSPNLETCEKVQKELVKRGCNLSSDGRPMIGLSSIQLIELIKSIDKDTFLVPCHIWTPWFSMFGANSGFDSIKECFGEYSNEIYAIETGLSSDPYMNWQIKELEDKSLLSFSDAHSLPKMGREATVFGFKEGKTGEIEYKDIISAIKREKNSKLKIVYTIEFYPEEGKYHYTGHRNCNYVQDPLKTKEKGSMCPVCHRPLTIGVMHRVEELSKGFGEEEFKLNSNSVRWNMDPKRKHPPFVKLVPLLEIIGEALGSTVSSSRVQSVYNMLCEELESELNVLLKARIEEIRQRAGDRVAEGVEKVRKGEIVILPGFDNQYGIVKIWEDKKISAKQEEQISQLGLDF